MMSSQDRHVTGLDEMSMADPEKMQGHEAKHIDGSFTTERRHRTKWLVLGTVLVCVLAAIVVIAAIDVNNDDNDDGRYLYARSIDSPDPTFTTSHATPTQSSSVGSTTNAAPVDADNVADCRASTLCTTPACVKAAAHMLESMDPEVDPCEDFYEFACGGWKKSRVLPTDSGHYAAYSILRNNVNIQLKALLEEHKDGDITAVKNAKNMYESCTNEEIIESKNLTGIFALLDEFGGWPILGDGAGGGWNEDQYNLVDLLAVVVKYNNAPLFNLWVGMDDRDNAKNVIFVDQIGLGMGAIDFYIYDKHSAKKAAYATLIRNAVRMLGSTVPDLDAQVDDIVEFETNLAKIVTPGKDRRDFNTLYNPMTIAELQNTYSHPNIQFDWLDYIQKLLDLTNENVTINEIEVIVQQGKPYYQKLFPLINSTPPQTIANYLIWRIVKNRLANMPVRFRDEVQKYSKVMYGTSTSSPRWKTCSRYMKTPFDMVLGRLFVEQYFSKESKSEVLAMINNIRDTFKGMIDELDWMDSDMKDVAKEKADYMVEVIGYPEYIFDDAVINKKYAELQMNPDTYFENVLQQLKHDGKSGLTDLRKPNQVQERRKWLTSPTIVNAFYQQQRNMITFPAAILQPSYFHVDHPRYLNYGGIGFMIGHEITHGFDDVGRQYDKVGNLKNWWKPGAAELYKEKGDCYINQYGNFTDPEAGMKLSSRQNQGENIADNGGVKETYRAYRSFIEANGGHEELLLPGLNFTQNQMFFLNFGQIRCAMSSKASAISHILNGYHSPNRFRVIGSLQNLPEFSEVFNCPVGSNMNPEKKCTVW